MTSNAIALISLEKERLDLLSVINLRKADLDEKFERLTKIDALRLSFLAGQYLAISDRELKENLKYINSEINEILELVTEEDLEKIMINGDYGHNSK
ncbi:MAG: hypothetical protein WBP45_12575 [Daejeonella sp.]